jgi:hypothetical protein
MPRRLLLLLAASAVLLLTALAGIAAAASTHVGAETRVGALQTAEASHAGTSRVESPCTRPGSNFSSGKIAVGFCVAADTAATRVLPEFRPIVGAAASADEALTSPELLQGLTPEQVDELAQQAGYEIKSGSASAANPATRYYVPGTNGSEGFRVLPEGVAGQGGIKGGPYLRFFGGANNGVRVPLAGNPELP